LKATRTGAQALVTTWSRLPERPGARGYLVRYHSCHACRAILARQVVIEPNPELPELYEGDWRGSQLPSPHLRYELVPLPGLTTDGLRRFGLRRAAKRRGAGAIRRAANVPAIQMDVSGSHTRFAVRRSATTWRREDVLPGEPTVWFPKFDDADLFGQAKRSYPAPGDAALVYCLNCGAAQTVRRVLTTDRLEEPPRLDPGAPIPPDRQCSCMCGCDALPHHTGFWRDGICRLCAVGSHQSPYDAR